MKILVTGAAGFIGFHLSKKLIGRGEEVIGLDNINDYYDPLLKLARLRQLGIDGEIAEGKRMNSTFSNGFSFIKLNLEDKDGFDKLMKEEKFDVVVNLAAQPGVRYSLVNPGAYVSSNVTGFMNVLEGCRHHSVKHLVYASTSSVYGANTAMPFSEHHPVNHPVSLYAATKKANELMAHTYSHLFNLPSTGLRFFTVYGPWGRPDMALFLFTKAILNKEPIKVFNFGKMKRDFTYVEDIVQGICGVIDNPAKPNENWNSDAPDPASSYAPYRIYNIGNNKPASLMEFINAIEKELGMEAIKEMLPLQPGDVESTNADISDLMNDTGYLPAVSVEEGVSGFVKWFREYYTL